MMQPETQNLIDLCRQVKKWHRARNLIEGATDKDQICKLIQEVGELSDNVCKGKDIRDDVGDIMVVLINIAERNELSMTECLQQAYDDIKDRRGMMVDGIFIKESDEHLDLEAEECYSAMQASIDQDLGDLTKLV